jgi:hypothetical protein
VEVDRAARVPQALARPAGAHGDDLGEDRDRRLRRRAGADVEAAGRNAANIPQLEATAPVLTQIVDEGSFPRGSR